MKKFRSIFEFYINSSIHVALAVVALCGVTFLNFDISTEEDLLLFVFFGSITGYNFVKYAPVARLHHRSLEKRLKLIQLFSLFSFLLLIWFSFKIALEVLLWTGFFGVFTVLYTLPVLKRRNLRSVSGVKVFIISFVWAGVTVILPVVSTDFALEFSVWVEFFQRFLLVLVLILPFEIRDLKYDLEQLGTIPQQVGVTRTKILGTVLLVTILILELLKPEFSGNSFAALSITALISAIFVWQAGERQSKYYASFWVESIPIFWLLILFLIKAF
ncbi:hypothetical protein V6B16_12050 [Salinimicrobium catena]|uniref:hypothetical protein n=1 Tax=Salinimicrobium catena TaxID=390640 RepID=UPI002FE4F8EE